MQQEGHTTTNILSIRQVRHAVVFLHPEAQLSIETLSQDCSIPSKKRPLPKGLGWNSAGIDLEIHLSFLVL